MEGLRRDEDEPGSSLGAQASILARPSLVTMAVQLDGMASGDE